MNIKITPKVTWVGKIDFELRKFHGDQITTQRGSSYNSYLIQDDKNILIDAVYTPFADEFIENLKKIIELEKIDYIIVNHSEPDHSGAIGKLMEYIPNAPIYCTASGAKALKGQYHKDWNFVVVKNGDTLSVGNDEIIFIEAPMMHWPDTMMCYLKNEKILFSNDVFGQHFAEASMIDDLVDECALFFEAEKYFANIISPFSKKAAKKISEIENLKLELNLICPAHGVIWRKNIPKILQLYKKWTNFELENQITIVYDSMYGNTRKIAEAITRGIINAGNGIKFALHNISKSDGSDIITDIFRSKGVIVGSSAINNGILNSIAGILEEISNLDPTNKKAAAFGSYGWSPKAIDGIGEKLKSAGYVVELPVFKVQWSPNDEQLAKAEEFGKEFALSLL